MSAARRMISPAGSSQYSTAVTLRPMRTSVRPRCTPPASPYAAEDRRSWPVGPPAWKLPSKRAQRTVHSPSADRMGEPFLEKPPAGGHAEQDVGLGLADQFVESRLARLALHAAEAECSRTDEDARPARFRSTCTVSIASGAPGSEGLVDGLRDTSAASRRGCVEAPSISTRRAGGPPRAADPPHARRAHRARHRGQRGATSSTGRSTSGLRPRSSRAGDRQFGGGVDSLRAPGTCDTPTVMTPASGTETPNNARPIRDAARHRHHGSEKRRASGLMRLRTRMLMRCANVTRKIRDDAAPAVATSWTSRMIRTTMPEHDPHRPSGRFARVDLTHGENGCGRVAMAKPT